MVFMEQLPSVPVAKPLTKQAQQQFSELKRQLNEITSWELAPNSWDKVQIAYTETGNEPQARQFYLAISPPQQKIAGG
jgi:hypothetical protein